MKMKKKEPEHYWNIRVLTRMYENSDEREFFLTEVQYDDGKPVSYSQGRYNYSAEDLKGLKWRLNRMKEATKKPILDADNFPNEWKE
jgi:hypothetical protein